MPSHPQEILVNSNRTAGLAVAVLSAFAMSACSKAAADKPAEAAKATTASAPAPTPPSLPPELEPVRTALDKYKDPLVAIKDGYLSSVACIDFPNGVSEGDNMNYKPGAMGVHFINVANIGPKLDPAKPQVLLYEWNGDKLQLNGAEWFMPVAVSKTAPTIFGKQLDGPMEGHEPILPADLHHWDLHVWLWKDNPNGLMHPTNSAVKCAAGPYSIAETHAKMVHTH